MSSIQDFIKAASSEVGVGEASVESATGGVLGIIKEKADDSDVQSLLGAIPGASDLLSGSDKGGGSMGGVGGALAGALGNKLGGLGGAASMLGVLEKSGLDMGQAGKLATMFFTFAKSQAGDGVVDNIINKIPELKKFID